MVCLQFDVRLTNFDLREEIRESASENQGGRSNP